MNVVILGVHTYAWGTFVVSQSRDRFVHSGPVCTGIPLSTYFRNRGDAVCWTASASAPKVFHCLEAIKAVMEGACFSASNVY